MHDRPPSQPSRVVRAEYRDLMIGHYRELFTRVQQHPGMYAVGSRFADHVTFGSGVDQGSGQLLLQGFREFLQTRIGCESNLAWPGLVLWLTEPVGHKQRDYRDLPADLDTAAVARWYQLLDEFLAIRQDHDGEVQLYGEYLGMLKGLGLAYGYGGTERLGAALDAVGDNTGER